VNARDELADLLKKAGDNESLAFQFNMKYWGPIADTILAAGYRKPAGGITDDMLAIAWDAGYKVGNNDGVGTRVDTNPYRAEARDA
jgi:hypothetical protein